MIVKVCTFVHYTHILLFLFAASFGLLYVAGSTVQRRSIIGINLIILSSGSSPFTVDFDFRCLHSIFHLDSFRNEPLKK